MREPRSAASNGAKPSRRHDQYDLSRSRSHSASKLGKINAFAELSKHLANRWAGQLACSLGQVFRNIAAPPAFPLLMYERKQAANPIEVRPTTDASVIWSDTRAARARRIEYLVHLRAEQIRSPAERRNKPGA